MRTGKKIEILIGEDVKDIPEAIKKIRDIKELSQDDVFVRTNIPQNLLSMYETRKRSITNNKLQVIVDGLDAELVVRFDMEENENMTECKTTKSNIDNNIEINNMKQLFNLVATQDISEDVVDKIIWKIDINPKTDKEKSEFINNIDMEKYGPTIDGILVQNKGTDCDLADIIANKTRIPLKMEVQKLKFLKEVDVEKSDIRIFNNEGKLLDKLYINEFEAMNLRYEFNSMDKLQSAFKITKEYLEKEYELNQEMYVKYNKFRERHFFENGYFQCWIGHNNLIELEVIIYDNSDVEKNNIKEEVKKLSFECEHKDISKFTDTILNSIKNTLEEYEVDTHSIDFKILETNLKEICKGVNEYLNLKRDIHIHEYSKSPYCLGPLNNYIFGMNTDTIDIDFWYYDASDTGYDPYAGGAYIGCDIRFFDDLDNYYFTDIVIDNIYNDDKYKDMQFENLVKYGLSKVQELMKKAKF